MSDSASAAARQVYFNGRFVAAAEAQLPLDDRGVLFGLGFFETFRTCNGRPHHWALHRNRLTRGCATAGLRLPAALLADDEAKLREVVARLLRDHGLADAVFRYTVSAGAAQAGAPAEHLALRPLPPAPAREGVCLRVLKLRRDNGEWLPRPKSLNYANALLGADELRRRSPVATDEGLFLAREGEFVVETARQNIAWVADGILRYPDPTLGAVAGTCLEWLLDAGAPAEPRRAPLDELLSADAIVVMNSVRGPTPVHLLCDEHDVPLRRGIDSAGHPLVVSLRRQWLEALEATAHE